jgi:hypothetical protein
MLCLGTIVRLDPCMWGMLGALRGRMLKALEGPFDVAGNRNVSGAINAVKNEGETAVLFGVPIDAGFVEEP